MTKRTSLSTRLIVLGGAVGLACTQSLLAGEVPGFFETSALGFDTGLFDSPGSAWWPASMTVADFNGDGIPDVATSNVNNFLTVAPRVSVILSAGEGAYTQPAGYITAAEAEDIVSADFDQDGDIDLIATNTGSFGNGTTVSLLKNNGNGSFAPHVQIPSGASGPTGLAVADYDRDGDPDLAVAHNGWLSSPGSVVSILLNNGDATFAAAATYPAGSRPFRVDAGDFNGDGWPDLAVANGGTGLQQSTTAHVLFNDQFGGFGPAVPLQSVITGGDFEPNVTVADMDIDGDLDVVYSDLKMHVGALFSSFYGVAIYKNDGAGNFNAPTMASFGSSTGGASQVAIDDVTGDGWPDILGTHESNQNWSIIKSNGSGGFLPFVERVAGENPTDIAIADIEGDGTLEAFVLGLFSQTVTIHYNDGSGDYTPAPFYTVTSGSYHIDGADIDGDGDIDLATSRGFASNGFISILENLGDGSYASPVVYDAPVYPSSVKLRDLNGDGAPDLLWADKYPPYSYRSALNNGFGVFGPTQSWLGTFTCGVTLNADAVDAFDLDGDGDLDPVLIENLGCAGGAAQKRIFVHENDGDGNFTLVRILETTWPSYEVMAADVNQDGIMDLLSAGITLDIFIGRGGLDYDTALPEGSSSIPATGGLIADVNGDGLHDVLLVVPEYTNNTDSLGVMIGNGDGTFAFPVLYSGTFSPNLTNATDVVAADIDGDGDLDALLSNYAANDISYFLNNGNGTFQPQVHFAAVTDVTDMFYGDVTGDGIGDVVSAGDMPSPTGGDFGVVSVVAGRSGAVQTPGDLDGDGAVAFSDLLTLLAAWGPCGNGACAADLDGSGDIGFADLLILLANWS